MGIKLKAFWERLSIVALRQDEAQRRNGQQVDPGLYTRSRIQQVLRAVERFFAIYKDLEGRRTQVIGWDDIKAAQTAILECHSRFNGKEIFPFAKS